MKPLAYVVFLSLTVAGCGREPAGKIPELGDRVLTVDQYLAQPELRKRVSALCDNDPGRMALTPNCMNAQRAEHVAAFGSPGHLRTGLPH